MTVLFAFAHLVHHLVTALTVPLLPFIRSDFGLNYTQSAWAVSVFSLSYGISMLPAGWLADRVSRSILLLIGVAGVGVAGVLAGVSTHYTTLLLFLAIMGFLGGAYHPSSLPIITSFVNKKRKGQAVGIHMVGGASSYFLAPLIAAPIAGIWGWRSPYIIFSLPTIIFGIFLYAIVNTRKNSMTISVKTTEPVSADFSSDIFRRRRLVIYIILTAFTHAATMSVIAFIPLFLSDHFNVSKEISGTMVALYYSSGLWASFVGGLISDRFGKLPVTIATCLFGALCVLLLYVVSIIWVIGIILVLIGIFNYMRSVISEVYILEQTFEKHRSTVLGIFYLGSTEGSGLLTPIVGLLIDKFGFNVSYVVVGFSILTATIVCTFLMRERQAKL